MTRYLVAVRRGDGSIERAPEPVGTTGVFALMRRLVPFQELIVAVLPDPPKEEGPSSGANTAGAEPESPSRDQTEQEHS